MEKTTVLGFYNSAHPREKMISRMDIALKSLQKELTGIECNKIGFICDGDRSQIEQAKEKIAKTLSTSSSILLIFAGWAQSGPILEILDHYMHLPMIIWSLAGYYSEKGLIAPAAAAGASLLKNTLDIYGTDYFLVYDCLKDEIGSKNVASHLRLAAAVRHLRDLKIASIGYACSNLYPFMYDGNIIKKYTGLHVDNLELLLLERLAKDIKDHEIKSHKDDFLKKVSIDKTVSAQEINNFSRYSIAMDRLIKNGGYDAITMKCGSGPGHFLGFTPCMLLSYISEKIEAICECDVYNLAIQLIIKEITGKKATFLEIFEFYSNSVLMASCGFAPFSLCSGTCIRTTGHDWGGTGGIMNISNLKTGVVNLLNLSVKEGKMLMQLFRGRSKTPENFQEEGWADHNGPSIPSLEITLDAGIDIFKDNIKGPHYIAVHGDISSKMEKFCSLKNIVFEKF